MKTVILKLGLLIALMSTSLHSNANLITNGGFELPDVKHDCWRWFVATDILGWSGSNIEVWDHLNGFSAFEGDQHIELNAHSAGNNAYSIYQVFETTIDEYYHFSFAYSARSSLNEAFNVVVESLFDGQSEAENQSVETSSVASDSGSSTVLLDELIDDHVIKTWTEFSTSFQAESDQTLVQFMSVFPTTGSRGNFLDAIQVTQIPHISQSVSIAEPSIFLLMLVVMVIMQRVRGIVSQKKKPNDESVYSLNRG